jgi:isoleucyl-tRNA synthetase
MLNDKDVKFVAWTTTPWTLPSNLAIAVNPEFDYVKLKDNDTNEVYILAECRIKALYKKEDMYEVLSKMKGKELAGIEYVPLFDYYYEERKADGCFRVLLGDFVTGEDGTGIVHIAPAFGEEDYKISCQNGII